MRKPRGDSGLSSMDSAGSSDTTLSLSGGSEEPGSGGRNHVEGIDSGNESDVESQTEDHEGQGLVKVNDIFGYDDDDLPATPQQEEDEGVRKEYRKKRRERSERGERFRERSRSKSGERLTPSGTPRRRRSLTREESASTVGEKRRSRGEERRPASLNSSDAEDTGSAVMTRSGSQTLNPQTPNSSGSNSVESNHSHSHTHSQGHSVPREATAAGNGASAHRVTTNGAGEGEEEKEKEEEEEEEKMEAEAEEGDAAGKKGEEEEGPAPVERRESTQETKAKSSGVSFALGSNSQTKGSKAKKVRPGVSSGSDTSVPSTHITQHHQQHAPQAGSPATLTPPTSVTPPPPPLSRKVSYSSATSTDFSPEEDDEGKSIQSQRRSRKRRVWIKIVRAVVTHPSFPLSFMFSLLFVLECVIKFTGWSSNIQLFKTVVPYFMVSWCTIQVTRLVYAVSPSSVLPLYLSFVPFPLFVVFSRENHSSLSTLWLLLALNVHIRSLKGALANKLHVKITLFLYVVLYSSCVLFMSQYFVDTSGVHRFYGNVLSAPISVAEELASLLVSLVFTLAMYSPDVTHKARKLIGTTTALTPPQSLRSSSKDLLQLEAPLQKRESSGSGALRSSSSLASLKYTIPFESLVFDEQDVIGRGASGIVYKGFLDQEAVAIKKLLRDNISAKEVKILSSLSHKYIIGFKGISNKGEHDLYIVTELVENGSIYDYLEILRKEKKALPLSLIKKWSLQIAMGMDYLHTGAPQKILHRDLKSRNILLDSNLDCKIADFGWSRATDDLATVMTNTVGTCAWMAPEVIRGAKYTEMVDVWSYGVVLWELVTGQIPYEGLHPNTILFGVGREPPMLFLPIPKTCPPAVTEILEKTWQRDSTMRPTFKTTIQMLEASNLCQDTDSEFAQKQREWRKEIAKTVKSQERLMSSEVSTQDPRALLEQITAKEQSVLLRTEEMNQQEARLRRRELMLIFVIGLLIVVMIIMAITTHKFYPKAMPTGEVRARPL